jgi:hypothetical protein
MFVPKLVDWGLFSSGNLFFLLLFFFLLEICYDLNCSISDSYFKSVCIKYVFSFWGKRRPLRADFLYLGFLGG